MPWPHPLKLWPLAAVAMIAALLGVRACLTTRPLDRLELTPSGELDPRDPPGTQEWRGSIYIARGGPVVIGFLSPSPARLVIASPARPGGAAAPSAREVVGRGLITQWMVLPEGATAIHFAAPPTARLMWSPVGRRGDPEYVPASSLSPEPPETATFDRPGATPLDGVVAFGILLVVIGSALMLARARLAKISRATWIAMGVIFVVAVAVRWIDLSGHGQTWDEDTNWAAGRNYITNIVSLDASPDLWSWNFEHPPVMKYLEGIGAQFADGFGPARALSALWIALGCALLVPIGTRLFSRRVGLFAAAIATLLPPLVAHGQIVGHESPTVLWWTLGILLSLCVFDDAPDRHTLRVRFVGIGFVIGLAVASRFVNGLLGPLCLAIIAAQSPPAERRWRPLIEAWVMMPIVALVTLYAVWPRLWPHPIRFLEAAYAKLSQTHSEEPFLGTITSHPGPHYFIVYLAATLPLGISIGVVAWIARAIILGERRTTLIMIAWLVIPLGVALSPVRQDGVRYVMPCVVALAVCAAAGFDFIATKIARPRVFTGLAVATILYLGITLVRVHPYYLDYFGEQVGGAGTVAQHGWFETGWWGEGVDRAVDYVNDNAPTGAHVYRECIEPKHLAWFRAGLWLPMAHQIDQADWIVTYSPQTHHCPIPAGFDRVFTVDANGAILAEVWKR
jgi:4-amino-4-deoxy-L-arabinose transferase-like glycosyltransferase